MDLWQNFVHVKDIQRHMMAQGTLFWTGPVKIIAFSRDGKYIATGSEAAS